MRDLQRALGLGAAEPADAAAMTEKSCEKITTGRPSIRPVPTTTPSAGVLARARAPQLRRRRRHARPSTSAPISAERALVDQPGEALAGAEAAARVHALDGVGPGFVHQFGARGLDRGDQVVDARRRAVMTMRSVGRSLCQADRRWRFSRMPAFSRSQVSAVMPSARSRCFCTFCVGVLGSSGDDADVARHHEVRHARHQEADQLGRIERARRRPATTAASTSSSANSLGTATAAASRTAGWAHDLGLDLEGGDVLAAPADRVLHAVDEEELPVRVDAEGVAGVEPAVAPRRARSPPGLLVVAVVHRPGPVGAHDQLADRAGRHLAVVLVDDARLDAGARPAAGAERRRVARPRPSGVETSVMLKTV